MPGAGRNTRRLLSIRSFGLDILLFAVLATASMPTAAQEEIAPFKLTNVNGTFSLRYLLDDVQDTGFAGAPFASSGRLQERLNIRTRSYVFHPAFLEILAGGGPIFVQDSYDSNTGKNSGRESLFGYDVALNALGRKRYPFTVFLRQDHPEISTGLSGRFRTETKEYGVSGRFLMPVQVAWRAGHFDAKGSGFGAVVDTNVDRASLQATFPYKRRQNANLALSWTDQESSSGSPGLPIRTTAIETFTSRLTGRNVFGQNQKYKLRQSLFRSRQITNGANSSEVETLAYTGNLDWSLAERVDAYSTLNYSDNLRNNVSRTSQYFDVRANFRQRPALVFGTKGYVSANDSTGFSRDRVGVSLSARYNHDYRIGRFGLTGSVRFDRTNQESTRDTIDVFDESVVLAGVVAVALREQFVVEESVIVTNVDRTQTFSPDIDYRLVTIGAVTTIERLVSGNILDGQEVLVSYEHLTGGTVEFAGRSQSLGANLALSANARLFARLTNRQNDVLSGFPTAPLNDGRQFEIGGQFDRPLWKGWSAGGEIRLTKQSEDISPFTRQNYDMYLQSARFWNTRARLGVSTSVVDYETSREDVDRNVYLLSLQSRLDGGIYVDYRGTIGKDDGGSIAREDIRHSLRVTWRYRFVDFSLNASRSIVTQGATRRQNTHVTAELRRVF